ncbi:DUF6607 family protein [Henriciella marina]|uniref:DUF6607 family protein n=1 Tax=Henriciella marina TaxID=453851 RepID=UPI00036A2446|nr:DUF6607 family protein [Henriciella marina]
MRNSASFSALACAAFLLTSCAASGAAAGQTRSSEVLSAGEEAASFERDRQSVLAMAGDYKVTFDFIETVPFVEGYELKDRKLSGGNEIVRVVEDTGDFISLQHILVVGPEDAPIVVKHWRQDWRYEPQRVLVFIGGNAWEWRDVPTGEREGAWSQTVYQVDDAPRYGAVGDWTYEDGIAEWTPPAEWRPLPRRDMTTRDDYHAVDAVNRHALTPDGWVHEQDNSKLILAGEPQALVREIGVNTYRRSSDFEVAVGDAYWSATEDYWAGVRDEWAEIEAEYPRFAITIKGETEALYNPLLGLANEVQEGERDTASAISEARSVIRSFVTPDIGELADRLHSADHSAAGDQG